MLIEHPQIYLDAQGTKTDALLVRDGKVVATGEEARRLREADEGLERPEAACLFPALADAHIHLWGLGLRHGVVDLRGMNVEQIVEALKGAEPQTEGWVYGANWDEHNFEGGTSLTLDVLDEIFPDNPVWLRRVDGHAYWVNSRAFERVRYFERYTETEGGHVERDDRGRPTGRLIDLAMEPVTEAVPAPSLEEDRAVFLSSCAKLREQGIAFCTLALCPVDRLAMLEEMAAADELPIFVDVLVDGTDPRLEEVLARGPFREGKLRVAGIKFFADGAMGSAGAHLLSEYRTGSKGLRIHPEGFLLRRIPELMKKGFQVAVHAIGDAAVREVLDAFEAVPADVRERLRPRLEHAQIVAPEDLKRFAELDVIASIQPIHLYSDVPWARKRLTDDYLPRLFPWRDLVPARFCGGSDYPIDDHNPWHGISTAITRKAANGEVFLPEHVLTREEALAAYTDGAAFACHFDGELGALHPGFRAEIALLDRDPFAATPEEIWEMKARLVDLDT